jgi:hypothetical protein
MSRGFFGGPTGKGGLGSKKGKSEFREKFDKMMRQYSQKRRSSVKELVRDKTQQVKNYKEMLEDMMDEKMFSPKNLNTFSLPGTVPSEQKEMTKGQKAAMELAMQKRAKERMKKREMKVDVIPKQYTGRSGGWIDKKGKIRNKHGMIVMEVDLDTGVITNRMGLKVGKYTPHSATCDFKIQRLIDQYTKAHKNTNPFAMKT